MQVMPDRLTVARLMAVVAALAVLLGAGIYYWEHQDVEQAMMSADFQMITQGDAARREAAAYGLGATNRGDPARMAALLALAVLGDPEPKVRQAAANSLPRVLTRWARANQLGNGIVARVYPPPSFGAADAEATAARVLLRALNDPQPRVRHAAVEAWRQLQDSVKLAAVLDAESGPALDRLLSRPDADAATRAAAVWNLARLQAPTLAGRGRLLAIIQTDPDPTVQDMAVQAILKGWAPQVDLYPILLARQAAAPPTHEPPPDLWRLFSFPPPPPEVVPTLTRLLEAGGDRAAVAAVLLGKGGIAARPYLAQIHEIAARMLQAGDNTWLACQAVGALVAINPASPEAQEMLGPLLRLLRATRTPYDRDQFKGCIAGYGAHAAPLVPDLQELLTSHDWTDFQDAADLLAAIGVPALVAIPDLEALRQRVRSRAVDAALDHLRQISPP